MHRITLNIHGQAIPRLFFCFSAEIIHTFYRQNRRKPVPKSTKPQNGIQRAGKLQPVNDSPGVNQNRNQYQKKKKVGGMKKRRNKCVTPACTL